ncbi:SPOR domain-containing protein [Cohnella lubricantis]|uniref:SPOR domain-containing protein n=1 Tax=Cohnella lubricantis TaxID=2163172 RepID=A0A841TF69_9BACL|nr:SPOR domain-containing protein [Cohnella lubricantis]MBB6677607.1 SPOR domain-containing protein [Cohnella lubricantis]MBP2116506.1 uncharacterized protein YukE [Cohnella lubricantis]
MQPTKARMTFRFDGTVPGKAITDTKQPIPAPVPEVSAGSADTGASEAWASSYQEDIQALEEMIRGSDRAAISGFSKKVERAEEKRRTPADTIAPLPVRTQPSETAPQPPAKLPTSRTQTIPFPGTNRRSDREEELFPNLPYGREEKPYRREAEPLSPELPDEAGLHDLPDELEHSWISNDRYSRRDGPSWLRVFVTVIGAIATGGLFGYLLLTLFTGEPMFPRIGSAQGDALPAAGVPYEDANGASPSSESSGTVTAFENGSAPNGQATQGQQAASGQAIAVPELAFYVLQYGVFQTEAGMNEAAQQLRDRGIAAATDQGAEGYRVYAGITPSKSEADTLASSLAGTQVYVKALDSGEVQLASSDLSAAFADYLQSSAALIGKIAGFTAASLSGESPSAGEDIQSIRTAHQLWLEQSKAADSWEGAAKQAAQAEIEQLNAAINALNEYSDEPSSSELWSAQSAAMSAALADLQLREAVQTGN